MRNELSPQAVADVEDGRADVRFLDVRSGTAASSAAVMKACRSV